MIKVGIAGANGYTGLELMRILSSHKKAELVYCGSRSNAGTKVSDMYPSLIGAYPDLEFFDIDAARMAKICDIVFTALPHAASAALCAELIEYGIKVIDLSADFRYDDIKLYEKTYKVTHPAPGLNGEAVYGLPELYREKIRGARLIANPGCYTTASILALKPLLAEGLINAKSIVIDAKSGTSGAGRKAETDFGFCEVDENFKAYAVAVHRHTSEIEEKLSDEKNKIALCFTPHLLPVKRGILATIYTELTAAPEQVAKAYKKFYGDEKFIKIYPDGTLPELKSVAGSNMCHIGFKVDERLGRLIVVSVIDNLIKGASGQAVQNMNILFGFDESESLSLTGMWL